MASLILCVTEGVPLSERRSLTVWEAVTELAAELLPEKTHLLRGWRESHVAGREELAAWLEACFRVRNYRPSPPTDLSRFYTGLGYDLEGAAKALGIRPREAAVLFRKMEKAQMLMACGEIAGALRHSWEMRHVVGLRESR